MTARIRVCVPNAYELLPLPCVCGALHPLNAHTEGALALPEPLHRNVHR